MAALGELKIIADCPFRVESDCSKNLEPDIPARWTDTIFRKLPPSAKAEEQPVVAIALTVSKVSVAALGERLLSGN